MLGICVYFLRTVYVKIVPSSTDILAKIQARIIDRIIDWTEF